MGPIRLRSIQIRSPHALGLEAYGAGSCAHWWQVFRCMAGRAPDSARRRSGIHHALLSVARYDTPLGTADFGVQLAAMREVGVPYTDDMIANAATDAFGQAAPDTPFARALSNGTARRPSPRLRRRDGRTDRDGCAGRISASARPPDRRCVHAFARLGANDMAINHDTPIWFSKTFGLLYLSGCPSPWPMPIGQRTRRILTAPRTRSSRTRTAMASAARDP